MKKNYLRLLSVMLCALFCSNAFAERLAFGFVVDDLDGNKYLCSFNPALAADGVQNIQSYQSTFGKPYAAAYAEDTYYLIGQTSDRNTYLQKVSLKGDKEYEKIGDAITLKFADMAYNAKSKIMYAITSSYTKSELYTVDLTKGTCTKKADLSSAYQSLTCSPEGQLYGITLACKFSKIDIEGETIKETLIKDVIVSGLEDGTLNQSLDFDTEANILYWAYTDAVSWDTFICRLDPETGDISEKKAFPNQEQIIGLCFAEGEGDEPVDPSIPELDPRNAFGFSLSLGSDKPTPFEVQTVQFCSFNVNAPQKGTKSVKEYKLSGMPQAASYVVDKDSVYLIGQNADGIFLYRMDITGENYNLVGSGADSTKIKNVTFKDMAYDAMNQILYGIADSTKDESQKGKNVLYRFNLKDGMPILQSYPADNILAIAALKSGQMVAISSEGIFGIFYPNGGNLEKLASLDTSLFDPEAPMDMEFDLSTLTLYWSYIDKEGKGHVAIIDPATGKIAYNSAFKNGEQVIGLYFPTEEIQPTATWYAFSMFSNTHDEDNGFVSLDPANLASVTPLGKFNTSSIAAAAGANGVYYAARTEPNGYGAKATNLATVNLEDGTMTNIAEMAAELLLWDMTYDYSTNTMYGITMEGEPDPTFVGSLLNTYCRLFSMDMTTHEWTPIAKLDTEYRGIACTMDGQLYAVTQKGTLCKVNKLTGAVEIVMKTGITFEPTFPASLEFDHANENLYCTYFTEANKETREASKAAMSQFDYVAKKVVDTRIFPGRDKLCGLYIPFERVATIPAKVTDLTVTPGENGALKAELKWTNPSKTYGGESLASVTKVEVLRDGTVITTLEEAQAPGKVNTYTDEQPTNGFHNYVVKVYNGEEVSEPAAVLKFVGEDVPGAPTKVVLTTDGAAKATITWEAPTAGLNTGWFNPANLKYKIVRQPDNKILHLDYEGNSIEDEVPMMNYYTYYITATSTKGEGGVGVSNSMTVGTAFVPPYSCDFMNDAEAGLWTLTGSWEIGNFGMGENYNGLIHKWEAECNSWAYSPLIQFKDNKTYVLTFKARSEFLGPKMLERVRITAGLDRTPEGQTVSVAEIDSIGGGNKNLVTYSVTFGMPTNNDYYLGFYCNSFEVINDDGDIERTYGNLQMSNITLIALDIPFNSIDENEVMNNVFVYANEGKIYINGEYTSAMVYNQLGAACPMNATLANGIYIVKVMNGNAAKTYKVLVK